MSFYSKLTEVFKKIDNWLDAHSTTDKSSSKEANEGANIECSVAYLLDMHKKAAPILAPSRYPTYYYNDRECGLTNPAVLHKQLVADGYLKPASKAEKLEILTVPELKQILSSSGLRVSGKKADLIQRILSEVDPKALSTFLKSGKTLYTLSDKGREFLDEHEDYIRFHRYSKYFTLSEYLEAKKKFPGNDCEHTLIALCNETSENSQINQHSYPSSALIDLYNGINDNVSAMQVYLTLFYESVNQTYAFEILQDEMKHKSYKEAARFVLNNYVSSWFVTPSNVQYITRHAEYCNPNMLNEIYKNHPIPNTLLSLDEFVEMLNEMLNTVSFDFDKWNTILYQRFIKILNL